MELFRVLDDCLQTGIRALIGTAMLMLGVLVFMILVNLTLAFFNS